MRKILLGTVASITLLSACGPEEMQSFLDQIDIDDGSETVSPIDDSVPNIIDEEPTSEEVVEEEVVEEEAVQESTPEEVVEESTPEEVVVVSTSSSYTDETIVTTSESVLVSTQSETIQRIVNDMVQIVEVVTETYNTDVTTKVVRTTTTTTTYSDDSVTTETAEEVISEDTVVEVTHQETQTVVDEYPVEPEPTPEPADHTAAPILTVEEYAARDDVNIRYSDTYIQAAQNYYPTYTPYVIQHDGGLGLYANWTEFTGATYAWSRGYTGKGSTIAILDTGIDTDHPEFENSIVGMECFTVMCNAGYETIEDLHGHGTHVAGIAAANLDGSGLTGVAPDANLLIGKVGHDNGYVEIDKVNDAYMWAVENGADAVNLSAAYNYDNIYKNSITEIGDGFYRSTDSRVSYQTLGYNQLLAPDSILRPLAETIDNNEAVFVVAAGNQGLAIPTFPAHMAVMEDADGNLAAGGKVIVAGAWDMGANAIASFSNRAGTMCFDYNEAQNTCDSDYRISDFYLMAPGRMIASTYNDGTYTLMSGTSMAAPAIAGGVALIHQMWPHMTGENIVRLMMETGDKTFANYDVNVHGQGIMDLDEATLPQGVTGIPTEGRVDGSISSTGGAISMSGMQLASLSATMIVDEYNRDFYVDANNMNISVDTRTVNPTLNAMTQSNADAYIGYAKGWNIPVGDVNVSISDENFGTSFSSDNLTIGYVSESGSFLGNMANSDLIRVNGADTLYATLNQEYSTGNTTFFGSASIGLTSLDVDTNTILKDASTLVSNSVEVGTRFNTGNGSFGLVASLPVAITSGTVSTEFASSVASDGSIQTTTMEEGLSVSSREVNLGAFYDFAMTDNSAFSVYAEHRENYMNINGNSSQEVGVMFSVKF